MLNWKTPKDSNLKDSEGSKLKVQRDADLSNSEYFKSEKSRKILPEKFKRIQVWTLQKRSRQIQIYQIQRDWNLKKSEESKSEEFKDRSEKLKRFQSEGFKKFKSEKFTNIQIWEAQKNSTLKKSERFRRDQIWEIYENSSRRNSERFKKDSLREIQPEIVYLTNSVESKYTPPPTEHVFPRARRTHTAPAATNDPVATRG